MALNIIWKGSPNRDKNRTIIDRICIHWFGIGTLESANSRFQSAANQVSAHYGISGSTIWQWVKEEEVAYHAGNYAMNQRSIGIEHDATTEHLLSEESYKTSAALIKEISKRHNVPLDRQHIIKHSEVKATQCCGTVDVDRLIAMAKGETSTPIPSPADEYGNTVRKSVAFDDTVGYLELGDPNKLGFEDVKRAIAGIKSRTTDFENQVSEKDTQLAEANTEIKNQKDKVANTERECQRQLDLQKAHYEAIIATTPSAEKLKGQYEGTIKDLQNQLREAEKEGGQKDIEIAGLKAEAEETKKQLRLFKLLTDIFKKIIRKK